METCIKKRSAICEHEINELRLCLLRRPRNVNN